MIMSKKALVTWIIALALCAGLSGVGYAENLCKVISPKRFSKLHSFPVKIVVEFGQGAQRETFRTLLNGIDITSRFEAIDNGVQALVGPQDGLRIEVRKDPRYKINILRTSVKGLQEEEEVVFETFFFLEVDKLITLVSKGGRIQSLDGRFVLDVPEHALSSRTSIALTKVRGTGQTGPAFHLAPERVHFRQPVTVTMKYDPDSLLPGVMADDLFLALGNEYPAKLENILVDKTAHTVSGTVTSFSKVFMSYYMKIGKKLRDIPSATSFRYPIGNHSDASYNCGQDDKPPSSSDLGETLTLLHQSSYPNADDPKILFNEKDPAVAWHVTTAFNRRYTGAASEFPRDRRASSREGEFSNGEDWHFVGYRNDDRRLPVHAIADGLVVYNSRDRRNTVVIAHKIPSGPVLSVYSYMGERSPCAVGTAVRKNNVIGKAGHIGTRYAFLHFEIGRESLIKVDDRTGELKVPAAWVREWTQDSVYERYYDPTNFILNMMGKHKWNFNVKGNDNGWIVRNAKKYDNGYMYRARDGVLSVKRALNPLQMVSYPLNVKTESFDSVFVTMRSNAEDGHGRVYFATDEEPLYSEDKAVTFEIFSEGNFHEYRAFMADNPKWKGTIVGIRIDLPHTVVEERTEIDFNSIRLGRAYLSRIPDTGQTKCYDHGQEITCPALDEPFYGQDGHYFITPPSYEVKTLDGHEVVIDHVTGLTWQRDDDGVKRTWPEAIDYCENLTLAGHSDWRLPTVKELQTITHYGGFGPAIDTAYFPYAHGPDDFHWSATTQAFLALSAWRVCFWNSQTNMSIKSERGFVRAVRGKRLAFGHFRDNGNGTVTDIATGLMWQQTETKAMTWEKALVDSENLDLAGYRDWRLPNIRELLSLVGAPRHNPAIDTAYFPGCRPSTYWSSTTHALYPTFGWYVGFDDGLVLGGGEKSRRNYVRAVRDAE